MNEFQRLSIRADLMEFTIDDPTRCSLFALKPLAAFEFNLLCPHLYYWKEFYRDGSAAYPIPRRLMIPQYFLYAPTVRGSRWLLKVAKC